MRKYFSTVQGAMRLTLIMYSIKVISKWWLGIATGSLLLVADAYHNSGDIAEALGVMSLMYFAARGSKQHYPFGRKNAEYVIEALTGVGLLFLAREIFGEAIAGLMYYVPAFNFLKSIPRFIISIPEFQPLAISGGAALLLIGLMVASSVSSFLVGGYQIRIGKQNRSRGLISNGEETLSDGWVEAGIAFGILSRFVFNLPLLEYVFGVLIAAKILHTGGELLVSSMRSLYNTLLHKSIGEEHEQYIRQAAELMHGVDGVLELITFDTDGKAMVVLKIATRCDTQSSTDIKSALAHRLGVYFESQEEFGGFDYYIRFDTPDPGRHREAYAMATHHRLADTLQDAAFLRVCDIEHGLPVRITDVPTKDTLADSIALLSDKRVSRIFTATIIEASEADMVAHAGIECAEAVSRLPENLGIVAQSVHLTF